MRLSRSLEFAVATAWLLAPGALSLPQPQPPLLSTVSVPHKRSGTSSIKFRTIRRATTPSFQKPNYNVFAASGPTNIDLTSSQDLIYIAEVTVSGQDFLVQLDTGSSDLWISSTGLTGTDYTDISLRLTYGVGYADGSVVRGKVDFAGFEIPSQAVLDAIMAENPVLELGAAGVLGLGFTSLSNIDHEVNKTGSAWGRSVLYNIFSQDPSVPNYITFLLSRSNDTEAPVEGSFTISEMEPDYKAVADQPKISTWPENGPTRWNVLLDAFAVNGKRFTVGTTVKGVSGKSVILLDSGTTYTYAPTAVVNSLYRDVTGAKFRNDLNQWVLPCDTRIEMTLYIGGKDYHLHPLDMVIRSTVDKSVCVGTFTPSDVALAPGEFDWLVGVNVLRSFYTLYDFGDPVNNAPEGVAPHVQLLQLRTAAQANMDFYNVRGGEKPPAEDTSTNNTPTDGGSAVSEDQSTDGSGGKGAAAPSKDTDSSALGTISASVKASIQQVVDYMPAILGILGLNLAIFLLLFIGGIFWISRSRKAAKRRAVPPALKLNTGSGDYKHATGSDSGSMRERSGLPNAPLTPTTPNAMPHDGLMAGQAPAPGYGLQRPRPSESADGRYSGAY